MHSTRARPRRDYNAPRRTLLAFARDLIFGRRRSFAGDGRTMLDANRFPRRVTGTEHIPREGSFVVVMNHCSRRGLRPYHCAFIVSAMVSEARADRAEVRWAFTSEMYDQRFGPIPVPSWLVRWVFRRVALVYDLIIVPRREDQVSGRAVAIRRMRRALERGPVGLTPEALGQGALVEPPAGSGLFLSMLAGPNVPVLPVAGWEEEDAVPALRFGPPLCLSLPPGLSRDERDERVRTQAMVSIGRLMPRAWQGAYVAAIEAAGAASGAP